MKTIFFVILLVVQCQITFAKKNQKIENYFINPETDLSWMTEKEKLSYYTFIFSLHTFVDTELNKNTAVEYVDRKYAYNFELRNLKFLEQIIGLKEGNAVVFPLALVPWVAPSTAVVLRSALPRALAHASSYGSRFSSARRFNLPSTTTVLTAGSVVAAGVQIANADLPAQPAEGAAPVPEKVESKVEPVEVVEIENPKAAGSFCLFGAQASVYKKMGDRFLCTAPAGSVNNPICADTEFKPSFLCQSFGLSTSREKFQVTSELCVGLQAGQGLRDLSARCSTAFVDQFLPKVKALAPAELDKVQKQILAGMNELGAQISYQGITYLEYCADNNKMNKGRQRTPCNSLMNIMDQFKKESPRLVASLESAGVPRPAEGSAGDSESGSR